MTSKCWRRSMDGGDVRAHISPHHQRIAAERVDRAEREERQQRDEQAVLDRGRPALAPL